MIRVEVEVRLEEKLPELRPYYDLPVGTVIPTEVLKNTSLLNRLSELGKAYCAQKDLFALAFTQIPEAVFISHGLDPKLNNCIYFSQNDTDLSEVLLINPVLKPEDEYGQIANIEGCGSIGAGKIFMVVNRPLDIFYDGIIHKRSSQHCTYAKHKHAQGYLAGILQHEVDHLQGKTALDRELLDFLSISEREWRKLGYISESLGFTVKEHLAYHIYERGFIVWLFDRQGKRFLYYPLTGKIVPYLSE